ncbi:hypothetical protein AMATHDRAFT_6998 [Amanita thiersii Skay4041]|uniref:Uncharacterized protein n=1 Tax=Amanita thiersii Skay4041 TaxID=703135 RepID=A0A2A9NHD0_9AGAR|nr:hypothetical protein AMATHDRAFT_6998 [Amanita thiersii Skay4041]
MDNQNALHQRRQLPPDAESRVILEARKEGVFAGLTSALASGESIFSSPIELA